MGTEPASRQACQNHAVWQIRCAECREGTEPAKGKGRPGTPACGTDGGYNRHLRNGTEPCADCRKAHRDYQNRRNAANRVVSEPPPLKPCGTVAAAFRHYYHGEKPCEPCREAVNAYQRDRTRNPRPPKADPEHGTTGGYSRHLITDRDPCDACREANNEYNRNYRAALREKRRAQR